VLIRRLRAPRVPRTRRPNREQAVVETEGSAAPFSRGAGGDYAARARNFERLCNRCTDRDWRSVAINTAS
jgi:hypothetical protein